MHDSKNLTTCCPLSFSVSWKRALLFLASKMHWKILIFLAFLPFLGSTASAKVIEIASDETLTTTGTPSDDTFQDSKSENGVEFPLFGDLSKPFLPEGIEPIVLPTPTEPPKMNTSEIYVAPLPNTRLACACGRTLEVPKDCTTTKMTKQDCEKIVGGKLAYIRDYPWTVALIKKNYAGFGGVNRPFCGGTLINNRYVLTASHCVYGEQAQRLQVLVNEQDLLSSSEANTLVVDVDQVVTHSGYDRQTIDNDIALLRLSKSVDISSPFVITRPGCLSASSSDFAGKFATVAGWGATSQGGQTSNTLMKVDVPVISNSDCNEKTTYRGKITDNMLCAGNIEKGGVDSCQGDSGGPLIAEHGGRKTLIGVVSWGHGCAQPRSPGVYTRVSRYSGWILENTRGGDWCDG